VSFYRRHLPHWQPFGKALFITWSLHDGYAHWLRQPEIARIVVDAIHFGAERLRRYDLHAFVVMSNHVHLIASAKQGYQLVNAIRDLKKFTSRNIIDAINSNIQESRRDWMNEVLD